MANYTGTLLAYLQRYADQWILAQSQANIDNADNTWTLGSPVGFGDWLLLEAMLDVSGIVTAQPSSGAAGAVLNQFTNVGLWVVDSAGATQDFVDCPPIAQVAIGSVTFRQEYHFRPEQPVLVRSMENLLMFLPAQDQSVTDVADLSFWVRARQLRPSGQGTVS